MKLQKVFDLVQKSLPNIDFVLDALKSNKIVFKADIVAEKCFDDSVFVKVIAYLSGTVHVTFGFDKIEKTFENYELINDFNECVPFFNAYIAGNTKDEYFLQIDYSSICEAKEKAMADIISYAFSELVSEDTMQYLKPLTERTVSFDS